MSKLTTHPVMHGKNQQFTTILANEDTCTGLQLDTLTGKDVAW